ncbi:tRNA (adenosine(37)-N6)-threonylcarbamoyltransferase complex transferase subunit TsaD [Candidatus Saccharibacteria bacterium]|nr:tRNA (adenosine(37)-N6)-threonylcarbamoyltransferase complex transferase subunit TsaD [Candidatus Saccharibacteria bacterium]
MKILGIESSCDETAASVVEDGNRVLSNVVNSQIDIHAAYGGVIPEIAARSHIEVVLPVINQALKDAGCTLDQNQPNKIDAIAVTHTPGLVGSLLVGTLTARTMAVINNVPFYPTHHLKSHIYANWLTGYNPTFPILALVVSGGHTQIIYMQRHDDFHIIGSTRDDAIGEVFDKVAKILGLLYPGGPNIAKKALNGDPDKYQLPIPKVDGLDFSFSGLKTAVLRAIQKELVLPITTPSYELKEKLTEQQICDFAASFQKTAVKILVQKLQKACSMYPEAKSILLAGGVSANLALREGLTKAFEKSHEVYFPDLKFATDNGAMVASAAYYSIQAGEKASDPYSLDISPRSVIK